MSLDYGQAHMGCPIEYSYRGGTFAAMGTIGNRIRQLRKAKELTQTELAKAISIDQSTLSDIERGAEFSAEILMRLVDELETTAEYVMRGAVDPRSANLVRAKRAVKVLTDEERLALFADIQRPGLPDKSVEERIPVTKRPKRAAGWLPEVQEEVPHEEGDDVRRVQDQENVSPVGRRGGESRKR